MNDKEFAELRRRFKPEKSAITELFGCYVNEKGEILSEFRQGLGTMLEADCQALLTILKKTISGGAGKNLVDVPFSTRQVMEGEEHKLLMTLRNAGLKDEEAVRALYEKVAGAVHMEGNYMILLATDRYDVPAYGRDGARQEDGEAVYSYFLCSVCPIKLTKPALRFDSPEGRFCSTSSDLVVGPPEVGFLFPAFDGRSTNLYAAELYTRNAAKDQAEFVEALFRTEAPMAAETQKETFRTLLGETVGEACSIDVVKGVHTQLCSLIEEHKASREPETLTVSRATVEGMLASCGVPEEQMEAFSHEFDKEFGENAEVNPKNLVDQKKFRLETPDVSIQVSPERSDLVETRILGGVKYILIRAEEGVSVNGVNIAFDDGKRNGLAQ